MKSTEHGHFVLENASEVETVYLAAVASDAADELEQELGFFISVLPAVDLRFEAPPETAHLYREQAIDSLMQASRAHNGKYPHLALAASGLLKMLKED